MRHAKKTFKVGRTGSHRRSMIANMLKSLIENGRMETTLVKAKELRRHADKMITLAKENTLAARRRAVALLQVSFNPLDTKEARVVKKEGKKASYSRDREVIQKLFGPLREQYT